MKGGSPMLDEDVVGDRSMWRLGLMRPTHKALACFLAATMLVSQIKPAFAQHPCTPDTVRLPPPIYTPDDSFPATDGPVLSLHDAGDALYMAGSFEHLGAYSGGFVALRDGVPVLDGSWPKVEGTVLAIEPDGDGGVYIGGRFERVGSFFRRNVAHLLADGTVDPCFAPGGQGPLAPDWRRDDDGFVHRVAVAPDKVILAGTFMQMGGLARNFLCAVSRDDGRALDWNPSLKKCWSVWDCGDDDVVNDLLLSEGVLYVGGSFERIAEEARSNLAAFDAETLGLLPWKPEPDGAVEVLERAGKTVIIGGRFQSVQGLPRPYLAALDAETGRLKRWSPEPDGPVAALCADLKHHRLYVGGHFTSFASRSRSHIARFALDPMKLSAWKPEVDGPVLGIALSGADVLLCGEFTTAGGVQRESLAALSATSGNARPWDLRTNGEVAVLAKGDGGRIFAGGFFSLVGAVERRNLAAVHPGTGDVLDWNPSSDGAVREMEWVGDRAYLGGSFFEAGGRPRRNLACVSSEGTLLPWNPSAYFQDYWPYVGDPGALLLLESKVFIGGNLEWGPYLHQTHSFPIVATNPTSGEPLPWNPVLPAYYGVSHPVNSLAGDEQRFFAWVPRWWNDSGSDLRALDPASASSLPFPFDGETDKLALRNDLLYIAGDLVAESTERRRGLVQIDTATDRFTPFSPGSFPGQERLGLPIFSGLFPSEEGIRVLVPNWLSEEEWSAGEGCCDRWALLDEAQGRVLKKGAGLAGRVLAMAPSGEKVFVGGALRGPWPNLHPGLAATRAAPLPLAGLVLRTDPAGTYQWNRDGLPIPGATGRGLAPDIPGSYSVTVGDAGALWTSPEVEVGP